MENITSFDRPTVPAWIADMTRRAYPQTMAGRPSIYTDELAAEICERISTDEALMSICKDDHMPAMGTVYRWVNENPAFRDIYARARINQAHTVADYQRELRRKLEAGEVDHQTAAVLHNIGKWEAARRAPKDYGDKIAHVGGEPGVDQPVQLGVTIEPSEAYRRLIKGDG